MTESRFPRSERLTGRAAFQRLFQSGRTVRGSWLHLIAFPNLDGKTRFACSVRKQAVEKSVTRHKVKRFLREVFRRNKADFPAGADLFALCVKMPTKISLTETDQEIHKLLKILDLKKKRS